MPLIVFSAITGSSAQPVPQPSKPPRSGWVNTNKDNSCSAVPGPAKWFTLEASTELAGALIKLDSCTTLLKLQTDISTKTDEINISRREGVAFIREALVDARNEVTAVRASLATAQKRIADLSTQSSSTVWWIFVGVGTGLLLAIGGSLALHYAR